MSIYISCGEPSGDHYAGSIIRSLRKQTDEPIMGMLGPRGVAEQGEALWTIDQLSLMGSTDILAAIPRLLRLKNTMVKFILKEQPRRVIVIDSPDFHLPLIRSLRKKGFENPIFYVAPPTVWAWRKKRVRTLRRYCTLLLPLLRFEHLYLTEHDVPSLWIGHPFLDETSSSGVTEPSGRIIALLPGSRTGEVKRLLPILVESARQFQSMGYEPVFSIAPGLSSSIREKMKRDLRKWTLFEGRGKELMERSRMVVGASGTASLEAMMANRFMIVVYKGSWLSWRIYKNFVKTPWVSLPNIMAHETVYPELLQKEASSSRVMEEAILYLDDPEVEKQKHEALMRGRKDLGVPGATELWTQAILKGGLP